MKKSRRASTATEYEMFCEMRDAPCSVAGSRYPRETIGWWLSKLPLEERKVIMEESRHSLGKDLVLKRRLTHRAYSIAMAVSLMVRVEETKRGRKWWASYVDHYATGGQIPKPEL